MALKVGELYATMSLDRSAFDRDVDGAGRRFDGLRSTIGSATRAMATAAVGVATATVAIGTAALRVGLDYNRMQQSSRAALLTLLGSAEAVNEQMAKLDEFARQSPFGKDIFIRGQQQLIAFGVEVERVIPALDAMQNAVAASGGSGQQLSELISIFAKISAAGKLTAQDFIEFGNRGIDAASLIGRALGTTGAEVRAMVTAGTLDVNAALDALVQGTLDRFGGATDLIKQQSDGARDRVKAAFRDVGSIIAAPFIDPQGGGRAVVWANLLADALRDLEQKAGPLVDLLVDRFGPGMDRMVVGPLERARAAINGWDLRELNSQIDRLAKYGPLVASTSAAIFALGSNGLILSRLGLSLNPVVAGIVALVAASPGLRQAGADFLRALQPLAPVARDLGRQVADTAMAVLDGLTPALRDLLMAAAPVVVAVGQSLGPALVGLVRAVEPVAMVLADVVSLVSDLPTPLLLAAGAFLVLRGPVSTLVPMLSSLNTAFQNSAAVRAYQAGLTPLSAGLIGVNGAAGAARAGITAVGTALKAAFISNPVGLALTALSSALAAFAVASANAEARADAYSDAVQRMGVESTEAAERVVRNALVTGEGADWGWFQQWTTGADSAADAIESLGLSLDEVTSAVVGPQDEFDALIARLEEMGYGPTINEVITKLYQQRNALADARHEAEQMGPAQDDMAGSTEGATGSIEDQNDALRDNISLQDAAAGRALSLREAQVRAADGQARVTDAITRYNEVSANAEATDADKAAAMRDVESALLANVRDYQTVQDAMARNNATGRELWDTVKAQREAFIEQATAITGSREEAERLADQYGLIPDQIVTNLIAETVDAARRVDEFLATYNGRSVTIRVHTQGGLTPYVQWVPGNANGAMYEGARRYAGGGFAGDGSYVPRVPQIARGGQNIVWAEPETDWEAYISGKPSMRMRNLGVLAEAADRFGYVVLPKGMARYASGHITPAAPTAQPASLDGMRLTGTVRLLGDGLLEFVDARISHAQSARTSTLRQGVR